MPADPANLDSEAKVRDKGAGAAVALAQPQVWVLVAVNLVFQLRDSEEAAWGPVPSPQPPLCGGRTFHTSFLPPERMPEGPWEPLPLAHPCGCS